MLGAELLLLLLLLLLNGDNNDACGRMRDKEGGAAGRRCGRARRFLFS